MPGETGLYVLKRASVRVKAAFASAFVEFFQISVAYDLEGATEVVREESEASELPRRPRLPRTEASIEEFSK